MAKLVDKEYRQKTTRAEAVTEPVRRVESAQYWAKSSS